jgi:hypothetical protein
MIEKEAVMAASAVVIDLSWRGYMESNDIKSCGKLSMDLEGSGSSKVGLANLRHANCLYATCKSVFPFPSLVESRRKVYEMRLLDTSSGVSTDFT